LVEIVGGLHHYGSVVAGEGPSPGGGMLAGGGIEGGNCAGAGGGDLRITKIFDWFLPVCLLSVW